VDKIDIITEIKKTDVAKLTSDMIKIPSYSFLENQEEAVAKYIYRFMQERGIDSEIREIAEGRYNVNSVIPGRGGGRSLMFCGHMDTVPAYDMNDAFGGRIMNGRIYGRGAVDMKGPMAAMMAAFAGIKSSGIELKGDLIFAALADEEETGLGAENLVKEGPFADAVIVGEPCFMDICLGHKGLEWIVVEVLGKKSSWRKHGKRHQCHNHGRPPYRISDRTIFRKACREKTSLPRKSDNKYRNNKRRRSAKYCA